MTTTTLSELPVFNEEVRPVVPDTVVVTDITTPQIVVVDTDTVDDLTKVKPAVIDTLPSTNRITKASITKIICGSTISLVVLGIISIIPLLQLIVGWRYANECPINWRIPHYLVVAGTFGLIAVILSIVQGLLALYMKQKTNDSDLHASGITVVCGLCSISIILFFLFIFLIGWFIAGCIWVFRPWNKVQYGNPDRADYCHPTLYRFAFWFLFISLLYHIFSCGRSIVQGLKQAKNRQRSLATPVPTCEP